MSISDPLCASNPPRRVPRAVNAFTLVELLVVIGIIALLISILLPALSRARNQANLVACGSNMRQIAMAFRMFSNDHGGTLPGGYFDNGLTPDWKRDWLFGQYDSSNFAKAPQEGTIFPYVNYSYKVYRCPGLAFSAKGNASGS